MERDRITGVYDTLDLLDGLDATRPEHAHVVYCNIVQFKEFNAVFGIEEGNRCLCAIAHTLEQAFHTRYVSRFSADHFVVVYAGPDVDERIGEAHRLVLGLRDDFKLWLEAGVCEPSSDQSLTTSCDLAKVACDQISKDGTGYLCHYTGRIEEELERKKYLQDHIADAIEAGQVQVYYQPVVRSVTGRTTGMEALSRWMDPTYGNVPPSVFVPALEEKHLSWHLFVHVVSQVCQDLAERVAKGLPTVPVSVNVSRTDFDSCDPYEVITSALRHWQLPSSAIAVEITESVAMTNPARMQQMIARFQGAGHEVWMDDFGSAYSSLNTLKNFTFDKLKLDMLFMHDLDDRGRKIVTSIIDMSKRLGIHSLAEGVETKEQAEFLADAGCEEIQGFLYSKPIPREEASKFLAEHRNETPGMRRLYDEVGLTKIEDTDPAGLVFYNGHAFRAVYGNTRLRRYLKRNGMWSISDVATMLNQSNHQLAQNFRAAADRAVRSGVAEWVPFEMDGHLFRASLRRVAQADSGSMLLVKVWDVTTTKALQPDDDMTDDEKSLLLSEEPTRTDAVYKVARHSQEDALDTLSALASIFIALITVDLGTWQIHTVTIPTVSESFLSGNDLDFRKVLPVYLDKSIAEGYRDEMHAFIDPGTLAERLSKYGTLSLDYLGSHLGWCRMYLIPISTSADGTVTKALLAAQDINSEKAQENRMSYALAHDELTKALNRTGLLHATGMVKGYTGPMAYTMIDVDNFKQFNDTNGHEAGDQLLARLARLLVSIFDTTDYVARIGGDEFVILLTRYDMDKSGRAIQRKLSRVNNVLGRKSSLQPASISAGIIISPNGYRDDLYQLADKELYAAKAQGKGKSQVRVLGSERAKKAPRP